MEPDPHATDGSFRPEHLLPQTKQIMGPGPCVRTPGLDMIQHHRPLDGSEAPQVRSIPSSLSYTEVKIQQALAQAEQVLANIRELRRSLEPFNAAVLGAAVNSAESEVQNIVYRLKGH